MFASCFAAYKQKPQAFKPFTQKCEVSYVLIEKGNIALEAPWSVLTATDYMDFIRTGNRVRFEKKYFNRRHMLNDLVLAELSQNQGRFMDAIVNTLWSICEESGWQLPSHNSLIRDAPQLPLPDKSQPVLDLFACETGAQLALVYSLLENKIEVHAPGLTNRLLCEINQRIITPYLTRHFWWMGNGDEQMMNWTPWCTQNVLICAAITPQSEETRYQICKQAAYSLDCFVKDYGEDGCCDEGAKYYGHAALCLFVSMEVLNGMTDGHFTPLYNQPKIRNIADFIRQMHIHDDYYINFADCPALLEPPGVLAYQFGMKTGNLDLAAFAAMGIDVSADLSLYTRLATYFHVNEIKNHTPKPPGDIFFPSVGLMIARDERFCLAAKAGDNADNHNHNDTGSFTLYVDGKPFIIDVGVGTYTKDTFSSNRYSVWTMQSAYHNLPTFGGIMQAPGEEYVATDVAFNTDENKTSLSMNIANAYPQKAGVERYIRKVSLEKGRGVVLQDEYVGEYPAVLSLMLETKPEIRDQSIYIEGRGQIHCDGATDIKIEHIPITDPLLHKVWADSLYRVLISFTDKLGIEIMHKKTVC